MKNQIKNRAKISPTLGIIVCALAGTLFIAHSARADFLLHPNERVVFYGDSITEQHNYTRPFQDYVYARYPESHIRFFNAGWSGDQAGGALNRLNRDVLPLRPDVVTLCFGMNDGRYSRLDDQMLTNYRNNMDGIIKALTDKKIRVIIFSPSPVDYDRQPGWSPKTSCATCNTTQRSKPLASPVRKSRVNMARLTSTLFIRFWMAWPNSKPKIRGLR